VITQTWAFRVYGEPAPKGSMVGRIHQGRVIMSEQATRNRPWRALIENAAPTFIRESASPGQPLAIRLLFAVTRTPAAAQRTHPATQSAQGIGGDLDKLVRLALDALESCGVLTNDAQIVDIEAKKVYADDPFWSIDRLGDSATTPGMYCQLRPVGYLPTTLPLAVPHA
jgi:Holliday junction resolvase RusA-like endonuclease